MIGIRTETVSCKVLPLESNVCSVDSICLLSCYSSYVSHSVPFSSNGPGKHRFVPALYRSPEQTLSGICRTRPSLRRKRLLCRYAANLTKQHHHQSHRPLVHAVLHNRYELNIAGSWFLCVSIHQLLQLFDMRLPRIPNSLTLIQL